MMYLNWPHSMVSGTRNFFLSMSGRSERGCLSIITGIRSGYLAMIRRASALLFSNEEGSKEKTMMEIVYQRQARQRTDRPGGFGKEVDERRK